jgi:hypothetical protein
MVDKVVAQDRNLIGVKKVGNEPFSQTSGNLRDVANDTSVRDSRQAGTAVDFHKLATKGGTYAGPNGEKIWFYYDNNDRSKVIMSVTFTPADGRERSERFEIPSSGLTVGTTSRITRAFDPSNAWDTGKRTIDLTFTSKGELKFKHHDSKFQEEQVAFLDSRTGQYEREGKMSGTLPNGGKARQCAGIQDVKTLSDYSAAIIKTYEADIKEAADKAKNKGQPVLIKAGNLDWKKLYTGRSYKGEEVSAIVVEPDGKVSLNFMNDRHGAKFRSDGKGVSGDPSKPEAGVYQRVENGEVKFFLLQKHSKFIGKDTYSLVEIERTTVDLYLAIGKEDRKAKPGEKVVEVLPVELLKAKGKDQYFDYLGQPVKFDVANLNEAKEVEYHGIKRKTLTPELKAMMAEGLVGEDRDHAPKARLEFLKTTISLVRKEEPIKQAAMVEQKERYVAVLVANPIEIEDPKGYTKIGVLTKGSLNKEVGIMTSRERNFIKVTQEAAVDADGSKLSVLFTQDANRAFVSNQKGEIFELNAKVPGSRWELIAGTQEVVRKSDSTLFVEHVSTKNPSRPQIKLSPQLRAAQESKKAAGQK